MSETARYRHLTRKYCYRDDGEPGCGVDIGSQGDPVVPWAWQVDLPVAEFAHYNSGHAPRGPIQLRTYADRACAEPASLDFVYCSHVIEDFSQERWPEIFRVWAAMLKPGGKIIVLVPEVTLWNQAIANGQTPNCSHWAPEPSLGDISKAAATAGLEVIEERMTALDDKDYSILGVLKKVG